MEDFKKEFIEFMVKSNVLTFGDFTTKSGRKTPFFINTGNYNNGEQMEKLGEFYAKALNKELADDFSGLYGPAYKGIPLCITTSVALNKLFNKNVNFTFNRKEAKTHGEGGNLIGHKLQDGEKIVIVEDVITAGTAIRESLPVIEAAANVKIQAIVVSVDRMEKGTGDLSAIDQVQEDFGIKTFAIVTIDEVVDYLHNREIDGKVIVDDKMKDMIADYRQKYGA
ncbi:MAG: orotate phosphoribosyltransferase [Lentisphaeraceae bacterium]|nr:orotate phosphoribosyltransferase [Lentisphaeraceae bacterium]